MDYSIRPTYHYKPKSGWINDPNGLVYFGGYYHVFYQHAPNHERPWQEPMHWGHARTKDFLNWEELPVALYPDKEYDAGGCWSGTATVKDGILYLIYASVSRPTGDERRTESVSVAYSLDGVNFVKHPANPVIAGFPSDGCPDFRDPAVCKSADFYYCVMASGHEKTQTARLLLYKSTDLINWSYSSVMAEWEAGRYAECPSFINCGDGFLLSTSVCPLKERHYFTVSYGSFDGEKFTPTATASIDKGPDQYAGQIFRDHLGRNLMISWIPGWSYSKYYEKDLGCMSVPREVLYENGKLRAYPPEELRHLLKCTDDAVEITEKGFLIHRDGREDVVYEGRIETLEFLRDSYVLEVFVNRGEEVYTALV